MLKPDELTYGEEECREVCGSVCACVWKKPTASARVSIFWNANHVQLREPRSALHCTRTNRGRVVARRGSKASLLTPALKEPYPRRAPHRPPARRCGRARGRHPLFTNQPEPAGFRLPGCRRAARQPGRSRLSRHPDPGPGPGPDFNLGPGPPVPRPAKRAGRGAPSYARRALGAQEGTMPCRREEEEEAGEEAEGEEEEDDDSFLLLKQSVTLEGSGEVDRLVAQIGQTLQLDAAHDSPASRSEAETWSEDQTPLSYPAKSALNPVIPSFQSEKSYLGNQITNSLN
nr:proto-oncogene FRAT1 isoform X2 [Marmota flaviventris]